MSGGSSEKKLEQIPLKKLVCALSIGPWPRSDICVEHEGSIHKRWASKRALCLGRGLPCSCPALPLHKGRTKKAMHTARISRTTKALENQKTTDLAFHARLAFFSEQTAPSHCEPSVALISQSPSTSSRSNAWNRASDGSGSSISDNEHPSTK